MPTNLHLDHAGLLAALNQAEVARAVDQAAEDLADKVRGQGIRVGDRDGGSREYDLPVKVTGYHSDRPRANVIISHPSGLSVQAKHGALTRAASEMGFEVNG